MRALADAPASPSLLADILETRGVYGVEPLRTLAGYRRTNNSVFFGQNVIHRGQGKICVGNQSGDT